MEKNTVQGAENLAYRQDEIIVTGKGGEFGKRQSENHTSTHSNNDNSCLESKTKHPISSEQDNNKTTDTDSINLEGTFKSYKDNNSGSRKWFVFAAGYLTYTFVIGFAFNLSILYVEWLDEFRKSNSETALPQSICTGTVNIAAFPSSLLVTKFGPRKCGIIGGIIAASGLVASSFAASIPLLSMFLGLAGFGMSLSYISSTACVETYFTGRLKIIVLALLVFGSGAGMATSPLLLEYLIMEFGWRGTILIMAGIMLNLVVNSSCLFITPHGSNRRNSRKNNERQHADANISIIYNAHKKSVNIRNQNNNSAALSPETITTDSVHNSTSSDDNQIKMNNSKSLRDICKTLVRNKIYVMHAVSTAIIVTTFNTMFIFFVDFYQSKGISESRAVKIYMYINIISTVTRLFLGFLKRLPHTSVLCLPIISTLFGCISTAAFPFVGSSYTYHLMASSGFGVGFGFAVPVITVTTVKLLRPDDFTVGVGICMGFIGIFSFAAGPISGYIRDITGNYDASFFCASVVLFISCVSFLLIMVYRFYLQHRKPEMLDTVNQRRKK